MSDIHLNFLKENELQAFILKLLSYDVDGWIISGDIGTSINTIYYLDILADNLPQPIYFVLGNHDFYHSTLDKTTFAIKKFVENKPQLIWLTWSEYQNINSKTALVGDDGWCDARLGNALKTTIMLNDFVHIQDLYGLSRQKLIEKLNRLGDESVLRLKPKLIAAAENHEKVVIVTHVPPFAEASWHRGQLSKDDWLPWYSCKAMGDLLSHCAKTYPGVGFLVLCGHTHGGGEYNPCPNLSILSAKADYFLPRVNHILEV